MFTTGQFRVFSGAPADRLLSRPRRLLHEGRIDESETLYREFLASQPDLPQVWQEYFALLRHTARHADALALAERAQQQFGPTALTAVLRGAALVELGRFREGLGALDEAARADPDSGLVWHEAGYAAWRLGELSRALMALDRAFALEPHGATLLLRGRVLRQAGRYVAAEVAFEGAQQAAEFQPQREEAEREIQVTRRYGAFPGSKPDRLTATRHWFAETGAVPLTSSAGPRDPDPRLVDGFRGLARDLDWRFTVLVALDAWEGWYDLAASLGIAVAAEVPADPAALPLVVTRRAMTAPAWIESSEIPARRRRGLTFALHQARDAAPADVFGDLAGEDRGEIDLSFAVEACQHPGGRLLGRALR